MSGLEIKCKLRKKNGRYKYKSFSEDGREHYNLKIYLEGGKDLLKKVDKVKYKLHESFYKPIRISERRDKKFRINIWTWGMFNIEVTIYFLDGSNEDLNYYLDYELPDDTGKNYIDLTDPQTTVY